MKYQNIALMFLFLISFASACYYNSSYALCKEINITSSEGETLGGFAMRFYIDLEGKSNGTDMLVAYGANAIDFWRENYTSSNTQLAQNVSGWNTTGGKGYFWANITSIPNGVNSSSITVFYNATGVPDFSNATKTFLFFDNFDNPPTTTNPTKWTASGSAFPVGFLEQGYRMNTSGINGERITANFTMNSTHTITTVASPRNTGLNGWVQLQMSSGDYFINDGSGNHLFDASLNSLNTTTSNISDANWKIYEFKQKGTEIRAYNNGSLMLAAYGRTATTGNAVIRSGPAPASTYDWYAIRKTALTEPTYVISAEKTTGNATGNATAPIITVLDILTNPVYPSSTLQANVSAYDDNTTSISINYTWYMNGTATGFIGSLNVSNTSWGLFNLTPSGGFNITDIWGVKATPYDGVAYGATNGSTNNRTISEGINITGANSTSPQYDAYEYSHTLNATINNGSNINASFTINNTGYTTSKTNVGDNYTFTNSNKPPQVAYPQNFTVNWTLEVDGRKTTTSYNITSQPSGVFECNATIGEVALNFSIFDYETEAALNATYSVVFSGATTREFAGINHTFKVCVEPSNSSYIITSSEAYSLVDYQTTTLSRQINVSNSTQYLKVYMYNSSSVKITQLKVVNSPNLPVNAANISIEAYSAPSNYSLISTCTTNSAGVCVVYLVPNSQEYRYNITIPGGTGVYVYPPEVVVCDSSETTCYRTFTLGSDSYLPYSTTGNLTGSCIYYNSTSKLNCTANDSGAVITNYHLNVLVLGTNTTVCSQTAAGSSVSLSCTIPSTNNTFSFVLVGVDAAGNRYSLSSGIIEAHKSFANRFGSDGWIATFLIFVAVCASGLYSLWLSLLLGIFGIALCVYMGLIPESVIAAVVVGGVIVVAIIAYKGRV